MPEALFVDRLVNLVEEGIDVAVRIGPLPDSSLTAVRVGTVRHVVCGTPGYFAAHGRPVLPSDLSRHRIVLGANAGATAHWRFGAGSGSSDVTVTPIATFSNAESAIDAAMSGWALTRVLSYQIGAQVQQGLLETVLDGFEPEPWPIHVVHPQGRRASAKLRAFVDLAVAELRSNQALAALPGR
jgi:DNA-binding transcriptional LysR family regulator